MQDLVTVVMRCHNDMPLLDRTLTALNAQTQLSTLIAFDNASTDGSRELLEAVADEVHHVVEGQYVPGRVLNSATRVAKTEIVVFLNADCEPIGEDWLKTLIAPFADRRVGATFSRQRPRRDCHPLAARDTESAYGDGSQQGAWRHCFSMASCAIRRSLWVETAFDESLGYSEDIAWSLAIRRAGWHIQYVADSVVYHSHNYSNAAWRKRQFGEGKAEARIFSWSQWQRSFLRYSLLPLCRQMLRDARYCVSIRAWRGLAAIPDYRMAQMAGRRQGLLEGLREQRGKAGL